MRKRLFGLRLVFFVFILAFLGWFFFQGENIPVKDVLAALSVKEISKHFDPRRQPFAFVIENLKPLPRVHALKASECGKCHQAIYREWKASTHAHALRDIQFQAELAKKESPKWLCLNCHIPIQNQRKDVIVGFNQGKLFQPLKKKNPNFDRVFRDEAISCAACHVRMDKKTSQSYVIGPRGLASSPHPVRKNPKFLRSICQRCHNPQGQRISKNLICWFTTTDEVKKARKNIIKKFGAPRDCVDCHMPRVKRRLSERFLNLPPRKVHRHTWAGGGIPKSFEGYRTLLERGYQSGLEVKVSEMKERGKGDTLRLRMTFENARAGHEIPTGDPERFLLALARVESKSGRVFSEEKLRIGQTWKWNPGRKIGDNRIRQGEKRDWRFELRLPKKTDGWNMILQVFHVRLSAKNAAFFMKTKGINEGFLKNGQFLVEHAENFYPFATLLFREEMDLKTKEKRIFSPSELLSLSSLEKGKAIYKREY